ncbi:rhamnogalacturonan acetylesterase [uncultured Sphingomonas sp.]|uniref:rhamnogalacturonan acetylesterase n=1 Tax=uncultured Sphingomonas sp. TaxID=158754 RepID=UPI003749ABBB
MRTLLTAAALFAATAAQAQVAADPAATASAGYKPAATAPAKYPATRILIASDSTAMTYAGNRYPQTGWGQMLGCGLQPGTEVINRAIGGRSTKSFIAEGRWDRLMEESKPGDTVLIQFGHNDASANKPERWAPAETVYRDSLLRMIWEARGRGLTPVLVTPVARRSFGTDGKAKADFAAYSKVMRDLVAITNVPLLDLEGRSRALLDTTGEAAAKKYYLHITPEEKVAAFPKGLTDDTHFSELGARAMADLVADELAKANLPISSRVLASRPDLTRAMPLGAARCR